VGDVDKMAEYALQILGDPNLLNQLSDSSRAYALENFHVDKIIPQYIDLYQKVNNQDYS
jgi:glycosyltransferase involved in cell wall biosynthesis